MSRTEWPTSIALLGATGKTGREVLRGLVKSTITELNIYARSSEKLLKMFPTLRSDSRVNLHIGSIHDEELIKRCLSNAQVIICTTGSNGMSPSTIIQDSASAISAALQSLKRSANSWQPPRVLLLSSSTKNERLAAARPRFVHWMITTAFQMGYVDLDAAQAILSQDPSLLSLLLVQPNVLVEEPGSGFEFSSDSVKLGCSYEDLGASFVQLALNTEYKELSRIGVSSKEGDRGIVYAPIILFRISRGFFVNYFPLGVHLNRLFERAMPQFA